MNISDIKTPSGVEIKGEQKKAEAPDADFEFSCPTSLSALIRV
jgi:hypothetical protein